MKPTTTQNVIAKLKAAGLAYHQVDKKGRVTVAGLSVGQVGRVVFVDYAAPKLADTTGRQAALEAAEKALVAAGLVVAPKYYGYYQNLYSLLRVARA